MLYRWALLAQAVSNAYLTTSKCFHYLQIYAEGIGKELKLWQTHNMWGEGKDVLADLVKVGGYVISLGWTTAGFGQKRGFQKKEVHVFEQAAREDRYSMYVVVEQKTQTKLKLQFEGIEEE